MTWQFAVELFDDLAQRGLTTTSSIERAYKNDSKLYWRLVSLFTKVNVLHNYHLTKLCDELSWSEHFRPFFIRSRVSASRINYTTLPDSLFVAKGSDGLAVYKPSEKSKRLTGIEDMVVRAVCEIHPHVVGFFGVLCKTFVSYPSPDCPCLKTYDMPRVKIHLKPKSLVKQHLISWEMLPLVRLSICC
jgi:hypothetical protein